jgi:hypothetical protein
MPRWRRGVMPPLLEEVYERAAKEDAASTALILDRLDYLPGVADGPRKACVLLSEAVASSAVKDVDDARLWLRWAEISQQMADASDVVVGRCGAGIGDTVAHLHPPAGAEAHSSAPPTRPYVDIDGADATFDVARSIVARD